MEHVDVNVTIVTATDDPQAYLQLAAMYRDRVVGLVLVVAFERSLGNLSAGFSIGQELPDGMLAEHASNLDSLRSVERWAIDVGKRYGIDLRTAGGTMSFSP